MLRAVWDGGSLTMPLPERGRVVVGRAVQADIVIDHASLSRAHAAIELTAGAPGVASTPIWEDLGSSNGTRIRGRTLGPHERVSVGWNEPVELGSVVCIVAAPDSSPSADEALQALHAKDDLDKWIERVASTDMSVLLLGETGVGKGFYARRIHDRSHRARGPFMHINCAALPDQLLESELFGYERGAFTGANATKPGLLEAASGGTVFLDEIAELSAATQAKLLVALERREVMRIGAVKPRPFDVRFLSATNKDLQQQAEAGRFRSDLFFRIAGLPLMVPPLRERRNEIASLAALFAAQAAERMKRPSPTLSADAIEALSAYAWPGNVRELMATMERAVLLSDRVVSRAQIVASLHSGMSKMPSGPQPLGPQPGPGHAMGPPSAPPSAPSFGPYPVRDPAGGPPSNAAGAPPAPLAPPPPSSAGRPSSPGDEAERIRQALERCAGNQSRAAELLGISRRTLLHKLDMFGLPRPRKK